MLDFFRKLFSSRRGYTRNLTPDELQLASEPQSKRDLFFLRVMCKDCNLSIQVPWRDLRNTDAMSANDRLAWVQNNADREYHCRGCGVPYLVTWSGRKVTVMKRFGY
jgi:hypothetical protein